jgi:hypothetical protein
MRRSLLTLPLAVAVLVVGTADAAPKPKPVTGTYDVVAPVPFPMTTDVPEMYGCIDGVEGASKNTTRVTLPFNGTMSAQVTYTGDWDLYVLDTKGKMIGAAETSETGNTGASKEKLTIKKAKKGPVDIVACNWSGLPDGTVTWTLTPPK